MIFSVSHKVEINEEEAWKVLIEIDPDESGEVLLKLKDRILKKFPLLDKRLKDQEWRSYLWEVGAENDKRVIQARGELEKFKEELGLPDNQFKESGYYIALDNLMNIKRVVVRELLKE